MIRSSRPLTAARRTLLLASAVGGLMLAAAPVASAATLPLPTLPSALGEASPVGGLPVVGGLADSVIGIVIGTYYGIVGASSAVVCPMVTPLCSTTPAR